MFCTKNKMMNFYDFFWETIYPEKDKKGITPEARRSPTRIYDENYYYITNPVFNFYVDDRNTAFDLCQTYISKIFNQQKITTPHFKLSNELAVQVLYSVILWESNHCQGSDESFITLANVNSPMDSLSDFYPEYGDRFTFFYYGIRDLSGITSSTIYSPSKRYRIFRNQLQMIDHYNLVKECLEKDGFLTLDNQGKLTLYINQKTKNNDFDSFSFSDFKEDPDKQIVIIKGIDFSFKKKYAYSSKNSLYLCEINVAYQRISVYFNVMQSSALGVYFIKNKSTYIKNTALTKADDYQIETLRSLYLAFCKFLQKSKIFTEILNSCYCFNNDYVLYNLLKDSKNGELLDGSIKDQLYCASENCYNSKDSEVISPSTIMTLNPYCDQPIKICQQNLNFKDSKISRAKIDLSCSCDGCNDPKKCYKHMCLMPEDIMYLSKKETTNIFIICLTVGISVLFVLLGFFVFMFMRRIKARNEKY